VPSAPRDFEVTLSQEDPPVARLTWRRPAQLHGDLLGYRLTYGSLAAHYVVTDQRLLDPDKRSFTTGFLGQYIARHANGYLPSQLTGCDCNSLTLLYRCHHQTV